MILVFASRNREKIREMAFALEGLPVEVMGVSDFPGLQPVEETGSTLAENALLKARAAHQATGHLSLADDTGLEVDALDGAPGAHSARFAGPEQDYQRNCLKLLEEMKGVPWERRTARFRTVVAIVFPDGRTALAEGVCEGVITEQPRGDGGFGYDPLFYYPPAGKTFAEMSLEEKNSVSHRGRAMRAARDILSEWLSRHPAG